MNARNIYVCHPAVLVLVVTDRPLPRNQAKCAGVWMGWTLISALVLIPVKNETSQHTDEGRMVFRTMKNRGRSLYLMIIGTNVNRANPIKSTFAEFSVEYNGLCKTVVVTDNEPLTHGLFHIIERQALLTANKHAVSLPNFAYCARVLEYLLGPVSFIYAPSHMFSAAIE